jgi:glutaryl-CoA dehydrogenase
MAADPVDFLELEEHLTHEERLVRTAVAQFVKQQVVPVVSECFEAGRFPRELTAGLGKLGVLGMHLRGYGCAGSNAVAYGLACMELEAGDTGIRSFVSVQGSLAMFAIYRWGSEDQKNRWLPPMARGESIGCFGLTEADFGSNPGGMRTYARRDGSDWLLRGTKMWISNGSISDVAIVWAQSDDGIRGFVVPASTKGFAARDIKHKLSLRASVTSELVLDDCRLPADAVLPAARGLGGPLACLAEARYGIVWGAMGAARSCYQTALEYATSRVQFDRPIAGFQLVQRRLVEMMLEYQKGTLLALHLGRMKDAGRLRPDQVSFGKLNNVRAALEIARSARSVLGGSGITLEYPVMRHMTNLESVATYEGTEEIHTLILGEAITGLSAFT